MFPALGYWSEFARSKCWVAGYIQIEAGTVLSDDVTGEVRTSNWVFMLDLRGASPLAGASRSITQKIRKAGKIGATLVEDRQLLAAALMDLYPDTMRRVGARSQYGFSAETLHRWAGDPDSMVLGAQLEGRIEAVILVLVAKCRAEYHICANTVRGCDLTAWLLQSCIESCVRRGWPH
jgi:hypothetical protein